MAIWSLKHHAQASVANALSGKDRFFANSDRGGNLSAKKSTGTIIDYAGIKTGTHAARLGTTPTEQEGVLWRETETGLIYLGTGSAWDIWKAEGIVRKTAPETLNNISALQNDDHLLFPVESNEVWTVEHLLSITAASTTPDGKVGWSLPSGTYEISRNNEMGRPTGESPGTVQGGNIPFGLINGKVFVRLYSLLMIGATGGMANMTWAHNVAAVAEDVTMNVNSCLFLKRIV